MRSLSKNPGRAMTVAEAIDQLLCYLMLLCGKDSQRALLPKTRVAAHYLRGRLSRIGLKLAVYDVPRTYAGAEIASVTTDGPRLLTEPVLARPSRGGKVEGCGTWIEVS